jgi:hypothetical protein
VGLPANVRPPESNGNLQIPPEEFCVGSDLLFPEPFPIFAAPSYPAHNACTQEGRGGARDSREDNRPVSHIAPNCREAHPTTQIVRDHHHTEAARFCRLDVTCSGLSVVTEGEVIGFRIVIRAAHVDQTTGVTVW